MSNSSTLFDRECDAGVLRMAACHAVMHNMCHVQLCNSSDSSLKTFQKCTSTVFNSLTLHFLFVFWFLHQKQHASLPPTKNTNIPSRQADGFFNQPTHTHGHPHQRCNHRHQTPTFKGHSTHVHLEDGRV